MNALAVENRRLRGEVKQLTQRVAAVEASRWWRLHPRMIWRRQFGGRATRRELGQEPRPDEAPAPELFGHVDIRADQFHTQVLERGTFTQDWFTSRIPLWEPFVEPLAGTAARVLEIGSYEGLSACYLLWRLPDSTLTCVDTFTGSIERPEPHRDSSSLERVFDQNVALVDASRVTKVVNRSHPVLLALAEEGRRFDFVYVDGSHLGLDVIVDAALAWKLLDNRGVLVFDDYGSSGLGQDRLLTPRAAIDAFLMLIDGKYELLHKSYQVAIRKAESGSI
jgi:hypothetical protein